MGLLQNLKSARLAKISHLTLVRFTWALKTAVSISIFSTCSWQLATHNCIDFFSCDSCIQFNSIYSAFAFSTVVYAVEWKTKMWHCHLEALIPPLEDWYNAEIWSLYHQPTFKWNLIHNQVSFKWIINLLQGSLSIRCRLCFHFLGRM